MQATQKAVGAGAFADVKTQIATVRQGVLDSQNFWIEHKRDDAVKFNKDALAKIDEFQKVVATDTVDTRRAVARSRRSAPRAAPAIRSIGRPTPTTISFSSPVRIGGYRESGRRCLRGVSIVARLPYCVSSCHVPAR